MSTPSREVLEELAKWWRGVAQDEREGAAVHRRLSYLGLAKEGEVREKVWDRCAQQLELVLAGKPFNPDL